ncbi:hypothetical protein EMIT0P12_10293 [Pseudomonas sp. IT-P12]|uniref:cupin domain-containing protein n=1 Tax=Pseudomonas sp. IT-P12 TaxID=3026450 RepID=UPI0039E18C2F
MIVGNPSQPGPYVVRGKVPDGLKLMPHTHPEDRIYTVISGVFYIGQVSLSGPVRQCWRAGPARSGAQ